jgi:hypothetical protein
MNEFNTNKNKEMLWNILVKGGKFNNLPQDFNPQKLLENHVSQIEIKSDMNTPLVKLNKTLLSSLLSEISVYTTNPQDIKQQHVNRFNSSLKEKEDSFNDTMKLKTPESIDFTDKNEDSPIGDIEQLIEEQRAKRNLEIPKPPQTNERSVQDWLSGNCNSAPQPVDDMSNGAEFNSKPSNNITIGDTIKSPENTIIDLKPLNAMENKPKTNNKKNVQWGDSVSKHPLPNINEMFNAQTQKPINTKNIEAALVKILKNQDYIINAIHDLQDRI